MSANERYVGIAENPYQSASVPAGSRVKVYEAKIPRSLVGFVFDIGHTFFNAADSFEILVDGALKESLPFQRVIAPIDAPLHRDQKDRPWAGPIHDAITVWYKNGGSAAVTPEFYIEVALYRDD